MTRDPGRIRIERRGPRGDVVIDRRDARNALTWSMYDEMESVCDEISGDATLRVVTLRGAGHVFSSGTDIGQFTSFTSAQDGVAYERRIEKAIERVASLPVPTIAVVEGIAAGAGLLLAAACDIRVCTPEARFGAPIARTVGNTLSVASLRRLIALLGVGRVRSLLLTASLMEAGEAAAAGFVSTIIPQASVNAQVDALCERLAAHAPLTMRATREAIDRVLAGRSDDDDLLERVYGSADFAEGVRAFLDKRPPRWEGR